MFNKKPQSFFVFIFDSLNFQRNPMKTLANDLLVYKIMRLQFHRNWSPSAFIILHLTGADTLSSLTSEYCFSFIFFQSHVFFPSIYRDFCIFPKLPALLQYCRHFLSQVQLESLLQVFQQQHLWNEPINQTTVFSPNSVILRDTRYVNKKMAKKTFNGN